MSAWSLSLPVALVSGTPFNVVALRYVTKREPAISRRRSRYLIGGALVGVDHVLTDYKAVAVGVGEIRHELYE